MVWSTTHPSELGGLTMQKVIEFQGQPCVTERPLVCQQRGDLIPCSSWADSFQQPIALGAELNLQKTFTIGFDRAHLKWGSYVHPKTTSFSTSITWSAH